MGRNRNGLLSFLFGKRRLAAEETATKEKCPGQQYSKNEEKRASVISKSTASSNKESRLGYKVFKNLDRLYINYCLARVYKSFSMGCVLPEDEPGLGRLKAIYEGWFGHSGNIPSNKGEGFYIISLVTDGSLDENLASTGISNPADNITRSTLKKHIAQCVYTGKGVRRSCLIDAKRGPCTGVEVWVKGSIPVSRPWVQSMHVPPASRYNKLCQIAGPMDDYSMPNDPNDDLLLKPQLDAERNDGVFELDSEVSIYMCRLTPRSSVTYKVSRPSNSKHDPPIYEGAPKVRKTCTISTSTISKHIPRCSKNADGANHRLPCIMKSTSKKSRCIYVHLFSVYTKNGVPEKGGGRLTFPDGTEINNGDGMFIEDVEPGMEITIRSTGYDRSQFFLIDIPACNPDAASI